MRKVITDELKTNIVNFYLSRPMTVGFICKEFDICNHTFYKILKEKGVKTYNKQSLFNVGVVEDFFENIDSEIKAYFLGLLIADGCIYRNKRNSGDTFLVGLTLGKEDFYMLERFKEELKINRKIVVDKRDGSGTISVTSNKIAYDLYKYGVDENKTVTAYLPILHDKSLMPHLIRGIIDGDGYLNSYILKSRGKLMFRIGVCGTYNTVKGIRDYLISELGVFEVKLYKNDTIYMLSWASIKDFNAICNYLYKDATIYLKRKKDKFEEFKKVYC